MTASPYQSPESRLTSDRRNGPVLASREQRAGTCIIDLCAAYTLVAILVFITNLAMNHKESELLFYTLGRFGFVFWPVAMSAYFVMCESLGGRTLGKLVTGTKVVRRDNEAAGFGQILGRTALRWLPLEWVTIFKIDKMCVHDTLSSTKVISVRRML